MRLYDTLPEALSEIHRDLAKSPQVTSSRVQASLTKGGVAREAMNYGYTLAPGAVPFTAWELVDIGASFFSFWKEHKFTLERWLQREEIERARGYINDAREADIGNPALCDLREGNAFSYTYTERLVGAAASIVATLNGFPDTRRAYWPIFHSQDAHRAVKLTRIPCSLGYQFLIREVPGLGPHLHLTYLQRSCDFEQFFLSDIYFAVRFQSRVFSQLRIAHERETGEKSLLKMGAFSHFILSLHSFIEGEVY